MLAVRWHASGDDSLRWDCEECQARQLDRSRNCAFLNLPKEDWNPNAGWDFDLTLRQCPKSLVTDHGLELVDWWWRWRLLGLLPFPGSLGEQPEWVVDAFMAAESAARDIESMKAAEARQELVHLVNRQRQQQEE